MPFVGMDPLSFIESTVNAAVYQEILEHLILPAIVFLEKKYFIFQQNVTPAHKAKFTNACFSSHWITVTWLTRKVTKREPQWKCMDYCQEEDEETEPLKCRWYEAQYLSILQVI